MLETTINAIGSILKADQSVDPMTRRKFLAALRNGHDLKPPAPTEPRVLKFSKVAARLDCSARNVHKLAEAGLLLKCKGYGRRRSLGILESSLSAFINSQKEVRPI